jgi:hypothetical protein
MALVPLVVGIIGWTGAVIILLAYLLLSMKRMTADSVSYQLLNIVGAAAFVVNSGYNGAMPSAVLNVIWMAIGAGALWQIFRVRKSGRV